MCLHQLIKKSKNLKRKEVKEVRKVSILAIISICLLLPIGYFNVYADANPFVDYSQTIHVETYYNAFGMAVKQATTTTTVQTAEGEDGSIATTTTTTVVTATWHAGSLKTDTVVGSSQTVDSQENVTASSEYTDTYSYDSNGMLASVSGSGTYDTYDPETGQRTSGTITRKFEVRDGQALLISEVRSGTTSDKNGEATGETSSTTTYSYVYAGGQWVVNQATTTTDTIMYGEGEPRFEEHTTFTTTYDINEYSQITGISRTGEGTRIVRGSIGPNGEPSELVFNMGNYSAEASWHPNMGWYISKESYDWVLDTSNGEWEGSGDPAATGTVYQGEDGQWYMDVTVWSDESNTEYENITINLDLDALSPEARATLIEILQEYADSGEQLTLFGITADGTLSDQNTLEVLGLGKGNFDNHPFDYEGDIPEEFANLNPITEANFADFLNMLEGSPFWNRVFGSMDESERYKALRTIYSALIGGRIPTNGVEVEVEYDEGKTIRVSLTQESNGRLRLNINGSPMRHLSRNTASSIVNVATAAEKVNSKGENIFDLFARNASIYEIMDFLAEVW